MHDVAVIGAGPAGMMAAICASSRGLQTILIEKNRQPGRKLLLTGKGRCNLTNFCTVEEMLAQVITNPKFLTNCFYRFSSRDTFIFFTELGIDLKVERGNRVFPVSDKAREIVDSLHRQIRESGIEIRKGKVKSIRRIYPDFTLTLENNSTMQVKNIILATGGKSYSATGSDGSGYHLAGELGHNIITPKPSLVPLRSDNPWLQKLADLKLKNIAITIKTKDNKKIYSDFGELAFLTNGLAGPIILTASSFFRSVTGLELSIDLKPALNNSRLKLRLQRDISQHPRKKIGNLLQVWLPRKLIPVILHISHIPADSVSASLTGFQRVCIVNALKEFKFHLTGFGSFQEALITSGGIDVQEIEPYTMESLIVPGLYFAGEILDVDALTGGYNLQIAWSTGHAAGVSCCC